MMNIIVDVCLTYTIGTRMPYVRELLPGGGRRGDGPGMVHALKPSKVT